MEYGCSWVDYLITESNGEGALIIVIPRRIDLKIIGVPSHNGPGAVPLFWICKVRTEPGVIAAL